jgi:tetratricopeptide (TPR) repeat protein
MTLSRRLLNLILAFILTALTACQPVPAWSGAEGPSRYDPEAHTAQGALYYLAGDFDTAIAHFDEAIRLDPVNIDALSGRANAYFSRGVANVDFATPSHNAANYRDIEAAFHDYNEVIRIKPSKADAYYNRGLAYFRLAAFHTGKGSGGPWLVTDYGAIVAYVNTGDLRKAVEDFAAAIRLNAMHSSPDDPRPYLARGIAQRALRQYEEAFKDYDEAIRLAPAYAEAYLQRGFAHYTAAGAYYMLDTSILDRHELGAAIDDFTAAIRLRPNDAEACFRRGLAYAGLGQYDNAILDYDQAIQLDPDFAKAFYRRGLAHAKLSESGTAIVDLTEALRLHPSYASAYYHRGMAYAARGDYATAVVDFDEAILNNPRERWAYYQRGLAHAALGDYAAAIRDYTELLRQMPAYVQAYYHRGLAYAEVGDSAAAIADLETALTLVEPGAQLAADINAVIARLRAGD